MCFSYLAQGVETIGVEIFDERSFTEDELIAWTSIKIPKEVIQDHKTLDECYSLSGKQGEGKEGTIHVIISYDVVSFTIQTQQVHLNIV